MEKTRKKRQRNLALLRPEAISVLVINEDLKNSDIKTIEIDEFLSRFPKTTPARVYDEFQLPFARCLKAFLETHFNGIVEPMYQIGQIDGLTPKEIKLIENLYKASMRT